MEVVNGDALVVKSTEGQYQKIFFSSLRPPRSAKAIIIVIEIFLCLDLKLMIVRIYLIVKLDKNLALFMMYHTCLRLESSLGRN